MANDFENIDESLLIRYILDETTLDESQRIRQWLAVSEKNMQEYLELKKVWKSVQNKPLEVDADSAWQKVSVRIAAEESIKGEPVVRTLKRPMLGWYAAAVLLALVGMFALFQTLMRDDVVKMATTMEKLEQTLEDGSQITLNQNSKLEYPKSFTGNTRNVELEGEAFFDVAKNPEKPFVISTQRGRVTVLGTSFNVEANPNSDLKVYVASGRVKLESVESKDSLYVILEPGMTGVLSQTGKVFIEENKAVDALFWMDKRLVFDKTPLPQVFEVLERNYKIEFSSFDSKLDKCLLTARFREDSVRNILSVIKATFDIHFQLEENVITVETQTQNCSES